MARPSLSYGGGHADAMTGGSGNDTFRINFVGDIAGLAETIDGASNIDTLDFQAALASGAADISLVTLTSGETLLLGGTQLSLTAAQLGRFSTVGGTVLPRAFVYDGENRPVGIAQNNNPVTFVYGYKSRRQSVTLNRF